MLKAHFEISCILRCVELSPRLRRRVDFTDDKGFTELGFQGLYAKLGIETVFARPYNARAKVIERFFLDFQESFEKLIPSYIGTSIENKPAWMKHGEKLHLKLHENETNNHIPTVQEVIKYINCWLEFHNKKPCPNDSCQYLQPSYLLNTNLALSKKKKVR